MNKEAGPDIIKAEFETSAVRAVQYPKDDIAHIVFIGRSNVGKSSLINSLCRRRGLAKTSGTPGKTQTINFFRVVIKINEDLRQEFFLTDLPGYGYARRAKNTKQHWAKFIEEYLVEAPNLKLVCQLIDIRHPPLESDVNSYQWLLQHNLPVQVIATKADKLSNANVQKHVAQIRQGIGAGNDCIIPYSAVKGQGRDQLLDVITQVLLK